MPIDFLYPDYEVVRNNDRCIRCRVCERQCANEVHSYFAEGKVMLADESKCVNCHRCVSLCPTRALKIVKSDHTFKENANWSESCHQGNIQTGRQRRCAAFLHGQSKGIPRLLG